MAMTHVSIKNVYYTTYNVYDILFKFALLKQ